MPHTTSIDASTNTRLLWLKQYHPVYKMFRLLYQDWRRHYLGGPYLEQIGTCDGDSATAGDYLFQFPREGQGEVNGKTSFQRRKERAHYLNLCLSLLSQFTDTVFRSPISRRVPTTDEFSKFARNCDGEGSALDDFWRETANWTQVYGLSGVLIEMPRADSLVTTLADAKESGHAPYFVFVHAPHILDWGVDAAGVLSWVKISRESFDDPEADLFKLREEKTVTYSVYTKDAFYVYDATGKELEQGSHTLGAVPFVFVYNGKRVDVGEGISGLVEIAPLNRALNNIESLRDHLSFTSTFSILTLPVSSASDVPEELQLGLSTGLTYPAGPGKGPDFISPEAECAVTLRAHFLDLVESVFWAAQQRFGPSSAKPIAQSGVAKAYDASASDKGITAFADSIQRAENACHEMWAARSESKSLEAIRREVAADSNGDKVLVAVADYPDTYDLTALETMLANTIEASVLPLTPPTLQAEMVRVLSRRLFPKMADDVRQTVDEEIAELVVSANARGKGAGAAPTTPLTRDPSKDEDEDEDE